MRVQVRRRQRVAKKDSYRDETFPAPLFRRCHSAVCPPRRGYGTGDIVCRHGLDEGRWQTDGVAVGGSIGDSANEFEELRRADD